MVRPSSEVSRGLQFTTIDLGALQSPGNYSFATDINDSGTVVGDGTLTLETTELYLRVVLRRHTVPRQSPCSLAALGNELRRLT